MHGGRTVGLHFHFQSINQSINGAFRAGRPQASPATLMCAHVRGKQPHDLLRYPPVTNVNNWLLPPMRVRYDIGMGAPDVRVMTKIGRYLVCSEIASGGMATVHLGRLLGAAGFGRTVAVKRLHPQFAKDAEFARMFLSEAHLAARIRHPNVVTTLDVVSRNGELFLVMEYVHGEPLSRLVRLDGTADPCPLDIAVGIVADVLAGLHAAHEARTEQGEPLGIVHRDISPQNVLVGADGIAQIVDFGIAKAVTSFDQTGDGVVKGKLSYMAPEQIRGEADRRSDVYSASVVLWELLAGRKLYVSSAPDTMLEILHNPAPSIRSVRPELAKVFEEILARGLAKNPANRFATAREMASALESAVTPASSRKIGHWVERVAAVALAKRAAMLREVESAAASAGAAKLIDDDSSAEGVELSMSELVSVSLSFPSGAQATEADGGARLATPQATLPKPVVTDDSSDAHTIEVGALLHQGRRHDVSSPLDAHSSSATIIQALSETEQTPQSPEPRAAQEPTRLNATFDISELGESSAGRRRLSRPVAGLILLASAGIGAIVLIAGLPATSTTPGAPASSASSPSFSTPTPPAAPEVASSSPPPTAVPSPSVVATSTRPVSVVPLASVSATATPSAKLETKKPNPKYSEKHYGF